MENLKLKKGFNVIVTYFLRHKRPNQVEVKSYENICDLYDIITSPEITVMSIYFAVCDEQGSLIRGMSIPKNVRYSEYYDYKKKLHLEYCKNV